MMAPLNVKEKRNAYRTQCKRRFDNGSSSQAVMASLQPNKSIIRVFRRFQTISVAAHMLQTVSSSPRKYIVSGYVINNYEALMTALGQMGWTAPNDIDVPKCGSLRTGRKGATHNEHYHDRP